MTESRAKRFVAEVDLLEKPSEHDVIADIVPKFNKVDEKAFHEHFSAETQSDRLLVARRSFKAALAHRDAEAKALKAKVRELELAEVGAKEAFGHIVDEKRDLEKECIRLKSLLESAYDQLRSLTKKP